MFSLYLVLCIFTIPNYCNEICNKFQTQWVTLYAPLSTTDVNYSHFKNVSINTDPYQCKEGQMVYYPFFVDFSNRLNYYRWITNLPITQAEYSMNSQKCSLMMAMNLNTNSRWYTYSEDPHTIHNGYTCIDESFSSSYSNIYAGQSVDNPFLQMWQTTPAHILRGLLDDISSSKVGHRQLILCPYVQYFGVGHVCFWDGPKVLCGGCQMVIKENWILNSNITFIAWPPNNSVPHEIISTHPFFQWSVAYISQNSDPPQITINNIQVQSIVVQTLCSPYKWVVFKNPNIQMINNVIVTDRQQIYRYTVTIINCSSVPTTFQPTNLPTTFQPTNLPTTFQPTNLPTTFQPTNLPTTFQPTNFPTTFQPTNLPTTFQPTNLPTTFQPTYLPPTYEPSQSPTITWTIYTLDPLIEIPIQLSPETTENMFVFIVLIIIILVIMTSIATIYFIFCIKKHQPSVNKPYSTFNNMLFKKDNTDDELFMKYIKNMIDNGDTRMLRKVRSSSTVEQMYRTLKHK